MSPELDQKLCDKYPKIFVERFLSARESCMSWGLEVGDGWYEIIDTLCESLEHLYTTSIEVDEEDGKRLRIEPSFWKEQGKSHYYLQCLPPQIVATQVKEKFGTLRFYFRMEIDEDISSLIESNKYPELNKVYDEYGHYIRGTIHYAETASSLTCSVSGAKGQMHVRSGWFKVLSPEVAAKEPYLGYVPCKLS